MHSLKKGILFVSLFCLILSGCSDVQDNLEGQNKEIVSSGDSEVVDSRAEHKDFEISGDASGEMLVEKINDSGENIETEVEIIETSTSNLSNEKCAWGFRRMKDNVRPEFSSKYTKPLDNYEGIYAGNPDEKKIYLTFDEGYENGYTDDILDTLKEKEVTAVFFVTMPYVKQNADLVQRMIDEGHIVGNHTVNHPSMPEVTDNEKLKKEIMDLHNYVKENFNYEMTFLRPPKGEYSERTVKLALDLGYRTVLWSSAYDDWDVNKQDRLEYARGMIINNLHNGCVMLLHAVSKDNTALLGEVIDETRNKGYEFCSLEEF